MRCGPEKEIRNSLVVELGTNPAYKQMQEEDLKETAAKSSP
jgi:hypothetical protein